MTVGRPQVGAAGVTVASLLFSLAACTASDPAPPQPTSENVAPRPTASGEPSATTTGSSAELPARAEMPPGMRILAEQFFLKAIRDEITGLRTIADDRLIGAADAACDSLDRGDSNRAAYIVVAALLPELTELEQPVGLTTYARSIICPEHAS